MGIGLGIFLVVIGAILKFGITTEVSGLDMGAIGIILMLAGGAVIVLTLLMMLSRPSRRGEDPVHRDDPHL
ncbi:DUF6458 family protein [Salinactinospora qingdaonensis]|uniref:DUF6458 domain-containing protein n=1 Tax=Salinactinospora qingdaonensis TaxID=702744 RepID=A0ABP7F5E7_9ACTN